MSEISGDSSLTQSMINKPNSIFMVNSTASNEESSVLQFFKMSEMSGDSFFTQSMINQPNSIFMVNSTEISVYLPSEETLLELILQNSFFCAKAKLQIEQNNEITKQKQIEEMNSYDEY